MGNRKILIYDLQGKLEKWNCRIEDKVGEPDFELIKDFCLRAIASIERSKVYQLAHAGVDVSGFTIEEFTFGDCPNNRDEW